MRCCSTCVSRRRNSACDVRKEFSTTNDFGTINSLTFTCGVEGSSTSDVGMRSYCTCNIRTGSSMWDIGLGCSSTCYIRMASSCTCDTELRSYYTCHIGWVVSVHAILR